MFQILLAGAVAGRVSLVSGAEQFVLSVVGGALLGLALGYFVSKVTKRIDDAQIEITLTTILAYGTFLLARHLHLSGGNRHRRCRTGDWQFRHKDRNERTNADGTAIFLGIRLLHH